MSSCFENEKTYSCPICGAEIGGGNIYMNSDDNVVGCEFCLTRHEGCDVLQSDPEIDKDRYDNFMTHCQIEGRIA